MNKAEREKLREIYCSENAFPGSNADVIGRCLDHIDALEGQSEPVADQEARSKMNSDLCDFYMRWESDGDYLRCASCKRAHLASYADWKFVHASNCSIQGTSEDFPWQVLIRLLRPLYTHPIPAAPAGWRATIDEMRKQYVPKSFADDLLFHVIEALEKLAAPAVPDETGWLIEFTAGGTPCWVKSDFRHTKDASEAFRFARKKDAEQFLGMCMDKKHKTLYGKLLHKSNYVVTEHQWPADSPEQSAVSTMPNGWKLVPIELTKEMLDAVYVAVPDEMLNDDDIARARWAAALAASPEQHVRIDKSEHVAKVESEIPFRVSWIKCPLPVGTVLYAKQGGASMTSGERLGSDFLDQAHRP